MLRHSFEFLVGLAFAMMALPSTARAEAETRLCVENSGAAADRVIEGCDALLVDKAAAADAHVAAILLARAEALVRQGRLRQAIDDLGSVIARRPGDVQPLFKRAELHRTLGDLDAAIRDLDAIVRLEPRHTTALLTRAELHRTRSDRRRALADYAAVLRLEPSNQAARAGHKALAQEIERLGATMSVQPSR